MSEKFRIEKKSNFTVVSNDILMNNFMSMKATCLLMLAAEAAYTAMEAELQAYLDSYEDTHDYDEYHICLLYTSPSPRD